jgi:phosphoribosylamine--glycine ligase
MNVLLLGSGGREHALAWKLAQSPRLDSLHAIPGNPGIADHAVCHDVPLTDHAAVIDFCRAHAIGFVVVGPEAPLGRWPERQPARRWSAGVRPEPGGCAAGGIEGLHQGLCARENIPTAGYVRVRDLDTARAALARDFGRPV